MKSPHIYYRIAALFIALSLAACAAAPEADGLEAKRTALKELEAQKAEVETQIAALQKEIAALDKSARGAKPKLVETAPAQRKKFERFVKVQGSVVADADATVSARMGGSIVKLYAKEGAPVRKGALLAMIDPTLIDRQIEEVNTQLELAQTLFQKQERLWSQKIGSEIQYLTAKNNKESLARRLATLQEQKEQCKVIAPIDGVINKVFPSEGELAGPGTPICRIVAGSGYKLSADLAEAYAGSVKVGDVVKVNIPDLNREFQSRVSYVSREINPLNRTFSIQAAPDAQAGLSPNMIAYMTINDYATADAVVAPVNLIQQGENRQSVYVAVTRNGRLVAERRDVKVGYISGNEAEIREGLQAGDQLITRGYQELVDGQPIAQAR